MTSQHIISLSLAFQRSFPHVNRHVDHILDLRRSGADATMTWPGWCAFPVDLSQALLKGRYGYARDGVEPFLLSALVGWEETRSVLKPERAELERALIWPGFNGLPARSIRDQDWRCLYLDYGQGGPMLPEALGAFIFLDDMGEDGERLVFLFHLAPCHVEPVVLPLESPDKTLRGLAGDLENGLRKGCPKAVDKGLFDRIMTLCRTNLGVLNALCTVPDQVRVEQRLPQ